MQHRPVETTFPYVHDAASHEPTADLRRIWGIIRRALPYAVVGGIIAACLALAFVFYVQPQYQSNVQILLNQQDNRLLTGTQGPADDAQTSSEAFVATQIAVVSSDIVARRVAASLDLSWDPASGQLAGRSELAKSDRVGTSTPDDIARTPVEASVLAAVRRSLNVHQVEKSQVIEISVRQPDPLLAKAIADAYGAAYIEDQLSARYVTTRDAGTWLERRIDTLREQSLRANADVEDFRAENNLVATDGRLLSDQRLQQLSDQLATLNASIVRSTAKVLIFEEALSKGDVETIIGAVGTSTDVPESAPIRQMRQNYLEATGRQREIVARWGEGNEQAQILQSEIDRFGNSILGEARRILDGYRSELRTAQSEEASIKRLAESATSQAQNDSSALVRLRSLEQRSASYNALYQEYLARYQEAVQQQTLSFPTARVISTPALPERPIFPNKKIVLALSILLGVMAGGAVAVIRETFDETFRTRQDVAKFDVNFLGYLFSERSSRADDKSPDGPSSGAEISRVTNRILGSKSFATARMALEIHRAKRSKVLGVISLTPSLARSALALAYAEKEAATGRRVLLLDGDLQERTITLALGPDREHSIVDILSGRVGANDAIIQLSSGVDFLPISHEVEVQDVLRGLAAEQLKEWRESYDIVIVDLPPAGPISEARILAPGIDSYLCCVEWGKTQQALLKTLLQASVMFRSKMIGIIITDVNAKALKLYDSEAPKRNAA